LQHLPKIYVNYCISFDAKKTAGGSDYRHREQERYVPHRYPESQNRPACAVFCFLFAQVIHWLFVAVLLLCQCGSDRVDIKLWNVRRAQLQCYSCGQEAWLEGFTVSEFDPTKLLTAAVIDQARKHRKRPPDEAQRIEEHRKTRSR
jgi:hypothetical protein